MNDPIIEIAWDLFLEKNPFVSMQGKDDEMDLRFIEGYTSEMKQSFMEALREASEIEDIIKKNI